MSALTQKEIMNKLNELNDQIDTKDADLTVGTWSHNMFLVQNVYYTLSGFSFIQVAQNYENNTILDSDIINNLNTINLLLESLLSYFDASTIDLLKLDNDTYRLLVAVNEVDEESNDMESEDLEYDFKDFKKLMNGLKSMNK